MIERDIHITLEYHQKALGLIAKSGHGVPFNELCGDTHGWNYNDVVIICKKLYEDNLIEPEDVFRTPVLTPLGYEVQFMLQDAFIDKYAAVAKNCGIPLNISNLLLIKQEIIKQAIKSLASTTTKSSASQLYGGEACCGGIYPAQHQ